MPSQKDAPRGEPPPSAALATLAVLSGALFWCGGTFLFVRRETPVISDREVMSPLARLILFGATGTCLILAGLYGLWRRFRGP
jgi:hypothetical protein